jgi:1,4-alpha-glucan branching enzyme
MERPPLITCPFNAELYGHWWFEGPDWIEALFRGLKATEELELLFPSEYLRRFPENQVAQPVVSSWGNKGYSEVWLDGSNDWIYRHTHKAIERMCELVERYPNEKGLKGRALNQAAREVLLSQSSDWPFIMHSGTTVPYAVRRVKEHVHNFTRIYDALCSGAVSTEWLTKLEKKNNLFPDIDYRVFRRTGK